MPAPPQPAAGIGLRAPHYAQVLERRPDVAVLEVHSENFFGEGGPALDWLERFRAAFALSFHGVGLSLGSTDPLDSAHLARLAALVARFEPALVSEHLSWSSAGGRHANDLLPLPFTDEALAHVVARIGEVQDRLGRTLLVENVSSYVAFAESEWPEAEFVAEVVRRAGCGLLLDVSNVWVNARNQDFDPWRYFDALDPASVGEFHLGGFEASEGLLVDTHATAVPGEAWSLFAAAVERIGARPTVVEWDADLPALDVLLAQASRARVLLAASGRGAGGRPP